MVAIYAVSENFTALFMKVSRRRKMSAHKQKLINTYSEKEL